MSIQSTIVNRFIEAIIQIPHSTSYDRFDHSMDWSSVVFSNGVVAIECQTKYVRQEAGCAYVTVSLKQRDYDRLQVIIG